MAAPLSRLAAVTLSRTRRAESLSGIRPAGPPGGPPGNCPCATGCGFVDGEGFVVGVVAQAYARITIDETAAIAAGTRSLIWPPRLEPQLNGCELSEA